MSTGTGLLNSHVVAQWRRRRRGAGAVDAVEHQLHVYAIGIDRRSRRAFGRCAGVGAGDEACFREVLPGQHVFQASGFDTAVAVAVAVAACRSRGYADDVGGSCCVIARKGAEAILEAEEGRLDAILLRDQVADARAGDQFLALKDAAKQQSDNDQHDCDFDQGEALLFAIHDSLPPGGGLSWVW